MTTKNAQKATATLTSTNFAKLQTSKDFLVNAQIHNLQTEFAKGAKIESDLLDKSIKIGQYIAKGADYFTSKVGKAELFRLGIEIDFVDFYSEEFGKAKSAIYEFRDLGRISAEKIAEFKQKYPNVYAKRELIKFAKTGNIDAENSGKADIKSKVEKFSVSMDKENKMIMKGEKTLTLEQITLLMAEFERVKSELIAKTEAKKAKKSTAKKSTAKKATKVVQVVGGFEVVSA